MTVPFQQLFYPFRSAETAQKLLRVSYQQHKIEAVEQQSYNNAYSFIYYIEHGLTYLQQASNTPTAIKPVLLFYGTIQLIKACLLTVDPLYPESTSVLAHGVSARKRKKQNYEFIHDEVKIQKNGLFSHFSDKMFHVKQTEGTKFTMKHLLFAIPELKKTIHITKNINPFYPVGNSQNEQAIIPHSILDDYKMTESRFIQYFLNNTACLHEETNKKGIIFNGLKNNDSLSFSPLLYDHYSNMIFIPRKKEGLTYFPELMVHYLLLYNLSMICRYETEWWCELLHTYQSSDLTLILEFLDIAASKIPYYIHTYLLKAFQMSAE
ncbi:YaaC family protein [Sutcliffiella rhizosphaerae]|uniref:YaaC-like Protein n=1 Tax=Sutcliffiella rhizosphaerae TaxID=2880967 RepID=A0ABN8AGY2_9BACI|nr:YaaC family protein [Sutcliffiella rhizosphaerae]CAG9623539.1 hypothetical protein BACCIP111883_04356 [Sutcliffiella rhizosphaerae]